MAKLASNIESRINAVIKDNAECIKGMKVCDYLLSNLNQDGDYAWYLDFDGSADDEAITEDKREMVENFIRENYDYFEKYIEIDWQNDRICAYGYDPEKYCGADVEIDMQEFIDEQEGNGKYEVGRAELFDGVWAADVKEILQ